MSIIANVLLDWKIFVLGFGLLAFISIINTKIAILPVTCLTFVVCSVLVWFVSMCVTFVGLHKLLQKNEPLELTLGKFTLKQKELPKQKTELKPNPEKVKKLASDIDKFFINKWYQNISKNDDFTEESKLLLEEVISRLAEVQLSVSNKVLLHGILNIYLKHLKEFRRSLKRKDKYNGNVEELYRYSHICSGSTKPKDYFLYQLTTNLLRHFINSELWNSLPCHILVSILARKLVAHILNLTSNPEILNYSILNLLASKDVRDKYKLDEYSQIYISQYHDVVDSNDKPKIEDEKQVEKKDAPDGAKDSVQKQVKETEEQIKEDVAVQPLICKNENLLNVERKPKRRYYSKKRIDIAEEPKEEAILVSDKRIVSDPVKIYEPKSKNVRTWSDSKDLALGISFGQDPLDIFQSTTDTGRTIGRSTFWDTGDATVHTLHNIKDLQESTVNNALHKIGDFQDEAAGMVEGILDFGRAGLRKGLRLTGLQDNIENAKATLNISQSVSKQHPKKKLTKLPRSESPEKFGSEDSTESVWINPIQMDSPNYDGQMLLEKSEKTDEKDKKTREDMQIPSISMEQPEIGTDSPDPEYEDAADLATSIAKLRSLLQQRSSESSMSTPALSPMPPDEFSQRMVEAESVSDIDDGDGVMPSFYKFCAKTATGVFDKTINTIKTALPGNIHDVGQPDNAWIFIQADQAEADVLTRMKKLLTERKEYCTLDTEIDTAYEAIDSLDTGSGTFPAHMEFEDELDDFEVKLPITRVLLDIMCELLADTNSPFLQEPFIKAILLCVGTMIENTVILNVDGFMEDLLTNLITIPESTSQKTLVLEMDAYVEALLSSLPDTVKLTFGKPALNKALKLFIASLQIQKINQDIVLQIFELVAMKLIEESTQVSPPASA